MSAEKWTMGEGIGDENPLPVRLVNAVINNGDGTIDSNAANAANQTSQINLETTIRDNTALIANHTANLLQPGDNVTITGNLPSFASTPTVNLGTLNGAATSAKQDAAISDLDAIKSALQGDLSVSVTNTDPITVSLDNPSVSLSGSIPAGTNAIGSITNTSFASTQSGDWTITNTSFGAIQSGPWTMSATQNGSWSISNTGFAINGSLPTGTNTIGSIANTSFGINGALPTGSNTIGSIANTSFAISGAIPSGTNTIGSIANTSFASTQSGVWDIRNITGTISLPTGAATASGVAAVVSALGSPMQTTGGSVSIANTPAVTQSGTWTISNTSFGISGSIPAGTNTIGGISNTGFAINGSLPTGTNTIGSIANTTFAATQSGSWNIGNITGTITLPTGAATATGVAAVVTALGTPMQNTGGSVSISNTPSVAQSGTWNVNNISGTISLPTGAASAANQATEIASLASIDAKLSNLTTGSVSMTTEENRTRLGKGFTWSTAAVSVSVGNYLNVVLNNPSGSGKTLFVALREVSQTTANVLQARVFMNPGPISGGTTVTGTNRLHGNATTAVSSLTYAMATTNISTGTSGAAAFIPPNGVPYDTDVIRIIPAGYSLGFSVGGAGGVLSAAASIIVSFVGWEE